MEQIDKLEYPEEKGFIAVRISLFENGYGKDMVDWYDERAKSSDPIQVTISGHRKRDRFLRFGEEFFAKNAQLNDNIAPNYKVLKCSENGKVYNINMDNGYCYPTNLTIEDYQQRLAKWKKEGK